jgi:hypothetical protein
MRATMEAGVTMDLCSNATMKTEKRDYGYGVIGQLSSEQCSSVGKRK